MTSQKYSVTHKFNNTTQFIFVSSNSMSTDIINCYCVIYFVIWNDNYKTKHKFIPSFDLWYG